MPTDPMPDNKYQNASLLVPPVLAIGGIVVVAVTLFAPLIRGPGAPAPSPATPVAVPATPPPATVPGYDGLRQRLLFGEVEAAAVEEVAAAEAEPSAPADSDTDAVPEELEVARAAIRVQGIIYDGESGEHRVLLDRPPERHGDALSTWSVGDSVADDVVIRHIESRRVVVRERGELRELKFTDISGTDTRKGEDPRARARRFLEGAPGIAVRESRR